MGMAPKTLVTAYEFRLLSGLPWLAQLLYLTALRPYMAYATAVVGGPERRISLQGLREAVEVEPSQGRQGAGWPSKGQIRRALDLLVGCGLIERLDDGGYLVFYLPYAETDSFEQKKPGRGATGERHTQPGTVSDTEPGTAEPPTGREKQGKPGTEPGTEPGRGPAGGLEPKPGTHPVSGNRKDPLYSTARAGEHPETEVPENPMAWAQVFMDRFGYGQQQVVRNQKVLKLFARWVEQGVTVGTVARCVTAAELSGVHQPSPSYFEGPVQDALDDAVVDLQEVRAGGGGRQAAEAAPRGGVNSRWGR